jgi:hypothetical protein
MVSLVAFLTPVVAIREGLQSNLLFAAARTPRVRWFITGHGNIPSSAFAKIVKQEKSATLSHPDVSQTRMVA